MNENISFLSRKQRQANMDDILNSLNPDKQSFNTMMMGFTDIIQTSFYNYMVSECRSQKEVDAMKTRINNTVNEVMTILNEKSLSNPEDMIVLSTIMIEAINKSFIRQEQEGNPVKKTVK